VTLPALPLKRRLHHCNACRPKVLQSELASASRSYQDRALLHELQEGNGDSPETCALPVLSAVPLLLGYVGKNHGGNDLHAHLTVLETVAFR
jgi:hypothetical protein